MQLSTSLRITCLAATMALAACSKNNEDNGAPTRDGMRPATPNSSKYISQILEYKPAPGQFVNENTFGSPAGAQKLIGGINGLLSLGSFGGYVITGFDHSIENKAGMDFGIYGNVILGNGTDWSEPGIIMVMQDLNGNGKPDDGEWYELAGNEYNAPGTIRNYRIIYYNPKKATATDVLWKDNQGKSGYVLSNTFHNQSYYPLFAPNQDSLVFEGTLLRNTLVKEYNPVYHSELFNNKPVGAGYADNGSKEYQDLTEAKGRGYNTLDISTAVNAKGEKVNLKYIDFIKVYTGQNCNGNLSNDPGNQDRLLGEVSTEVGGIVDLHL
ncbi:PKD domain-containing protein [Chitinophaga solisilvae]|uniref:PKD domain-containing protein n=1 Tax=Chitinophaga solisilvae TaxID=1233460 RepID=UPI001371C7F8|nr:PKD domain-containing protein [Chitinophaga solisilvae]